MTGTPPRVVAAGASQFRRHGMLERAARRAGALVAAPAVRRRLKALYLRALTIRTGGRGLRATLPGGETVRVLPAYAFLSWNPDEYRAFREHARDGMTALDIGANAGAYALLLGQWAGRSGSVAAFEPSPSAFEGLRRHVRLNGLDGVVTPVRSAVGAAVGTLPFVVDAAAGEGHLASAAEAAAATTTVAVTTIDAFCARERIAPDFIKIDVEGAELDVLRGARATIERGRGRLALFVEFHPSLWPSRGISRADLERELERLGLTVVSIVPDVDPWTLEGVAVRLVPR